MGWLERFWDGLGDFFTGLTSAVERTVTSLFGSSNARYIKKLQTKVDSINRLEPQFQAMSDEELKHQTTLFRERLARGETVDDLLVEAFAVCREGGRRYLNMRHFDVQLIGGMVLHSGNIAEMVTGEGKTLVATLPAYLNALEAKGVHVVTVNDYLARRDMEWMAPLYLGLGLTVGAIWADMKVLDRQRAYACDITYGTNNEFGFDYLRDNMRPKHILVSNQNTFELLDVAPDVSYVELKKKYRNHAKDWHPDKFAGSSVAPELAEIAREQFELYSKAYEAVKIERGFVREVKK